MHMCTHFPEQIDNIVLFTPICHVTVVKITKNMLTEHIANNAE